MRREGRLWALIRATIHIVYVVDKVFRHGKSDVFSAVFRGDRHWDFAGIVSRIPVETKGTSSVSSELRRVSGSLRHLMSNSESFSSKPRRKTNVIGSSKLEKVNTTNPIAKLIIILWLLYFVGVGLRILGRAGFLLVMAFAASTSDTWNPFRPMSLI
jgi:hypothetical protein